MIDQNLPIYILAVPLLTAFAINLAGRCSRVWIAPLVLGALGFTILASVRVLLRVLGEGTIRYTVGNWRPPYGIELVVDPLTAMMLVLVAVVALLASCSALKSVQQELPGQEYLFFSMYMLLIAGLFGLVMTADAFNLYVLLEITSITTYGLIALGKDRAPLSSFSYIIMGSIGACFYPLGVGYLYLLTGTLNMADIATILPTLDAKLAVVTSLAFVLVGLWIKMAFFPLHGWLPNAYCHAPTGAGTLAAPLMTKVTVYLMVRVILTMFTPEQVFTHQMVQNGVVWAAALAILCGSALALGQTDLKRMLTYIIVAEVGYMVGGVFVANANGLTGAILHIANDALMTLCLFLAVAAIAYRQRSVELVSLQGIFYRMPWTMAAFSLGALAMIGVPPTCGFFSKWYLLLGGIEAGHWEFVAALIVSSLINVVLFFRIIEVAYFGAIPGGQAHHHHADEAREAPAWILTPLLTTAVLLVVVGLNTGQLVDKIIRLMVPAGF